MYRSINYWVLGGFEGEKSPEAAIKNAAEWGLDGVELTVGDCLSPDLPASECERIRSIAAESGIGLRTLASGFYWGCSLGSPEKEERLRAIDFTRSYLHLAHRLGAETILVVPGAVDVAWDSERPIVPYQQVWDHATTSLMELVPLAEDLGVQIGLENVWNKFLLSPIETRDFVDQFTSEYLGVYFDTGNCLVHGYPDHWIDILGSRIKAVHIKNYIRENAGGTLSGFGDDLSKGDLNVSALLDAFERNSLTDLPCTAEMIPFCRLPDLVLPDETLAQHTAVQLKQLIP